MFLVMYWDFAPVVLKAQFSFFKLEPSDAYLKTNYITVVYILVALKADL